MTPEADRTVHPRSYWTGRADARELDSWTAVAREVAATLAADVVERDKANLDPTTELTLLRDSGLVNLLVPQQFGGAGAHWETAFAVVRVIAEVDGSISQLLLYHYINQGNIGFIGDPLKQGEWYAKSAAGQWVWGDSVNPVDPDLVLVPVSDDPASGYRLDGRKFFSTGASAGDVILVNAVARGGEHDGEVVALVIDHDRQGVTFLGNWNALGQRLTASGGVLYENVSVAADEILGISSDDPFFNAVTPGLQLGFGNIYLGIARGALEHGRRVTLARKNSWFLSSADLYQNDPFVQRTYGEFVAHLAAAEAFAEKLNPTFDAALEKGWDFSYDDRVELEQGVAQLKVVSTDIGMEIANRIFETTGSSSATATSGLDLYWRNLRTHSLHDPVDYKKLEVGAYFLTGTVQPVSLYT
jgi:alkylation response protein AidB-like acyl-CoA dehydrogenase